MLRCYKKRSEDIHRDDGEGSSCWKKLKFVLMAECPIILCATLAFADYALHICVHMWPVKLALQRTVHTTLAKVSRHLWMIRKHKNGLTMRWWYDKLQCSINANVWDKKVVSVDVELGASMASLSMFHAGVGVGRLCAKELC